MSDESIIDEQSHYEISLTAGQAFIAFVLLLLSLAASFAFGLMIGRGQGDDRLVVKKEPSVVTEASVMPKKSGKIVELGVADDDFKSDTAATDSASTAAPVLSEGTAAGVTDTTATASATPDTPPSAAAAAAEVPAPVQKSAVPPPSAVAPVIKTAPQQKAAAAENAAPARAASDAARPAATAPVYAQLMSTSDQKSAEGLAAKLIEHGFTSAYVERGTTAKGMVFRVRVKFPSDSDARAAEPKLKEFSKDVWITK